MHFTDVKMTVIYSFTTVQFFFVLQWKSHGTTCKINFYMFLPKSVERRYDHLSAYCLDV
jgi:hypothetical protein